MTLSNKRAMRNDELLTAVREFLQTLHDLLDDPKWEAVAFQEADEVLEELERRLTAEGTYDRRTT